MNGDPPVDPLVRAVLRPILDVARDRPTAVAVVADGRTTTYGELAAAVGAVAAAIPPAADPIGVVATHTVAAITAALGAWAAGRAYVALDPHLPTARLAAMIEQVGCTEVLGELPAGAAPAGMRTLRPAPADRPLTVGDLVPCTSDAPAYVLFTSGSTGTPKPVAVPRPAVATVAPELVRAYGVEATDRVLHFTPLFWDTSLEEVLPTLIQGATLVIDDRSTVDLHAAIDESGLTVVNVPTAFWGEFVTMLLDDDLTLPPSLRTVVIGGEALRPDMLERWHRLGATGVRLLNTYGSTETTMVTHIAELADPDAPAAALGVPLPHVRQRILDTDGHPTDGPGQLHLAGPHLATGYRGMPDLTAERFVERDLGDGPRTWFATGDLVESGADGTLLHRGRADGQVKVRGYRVDLGDVETWVGRCPGVRLVAAAAAPKRGHSVLVAFVVPTDPDAGATLVADIYRYLRGTVGNHLVPAAVHVVPELRRTASRKIDRAATLAHYLGTG